MLASRATHPVSAFAARYTGWLQKILDPRSTGLPLVYSFFRVTAGEHSPSSSDSNPPRTRPRSRPPFCSVPALAYDTEHVIAINVLIAGRTARASPHSR